MIDVAVERIIMRDHKELIKMCDPADLHSEVLTPFAVEICRRFVKESEANIAQLFKQR
ncbi:hypothetical protein D3C83_119030 [compost metagenome]